MFENFQSNTIDINKKYHTVWDFGCSFSNYRWLTWTDMIAMNADASVVNKSSFPGSGIKHVYNQLRHVVRNHEFKSDDLVLVNLPSLTRWDIITAHNEFIDWSARGDYEMVTDFNTMHNYLVPEIYGNPKFHLADLFLSGHNYLEQTLQLFNQIECDKVIINTDPYGWDIHQRINHDDEALVSHLNGCYDIQTGKNLLNIFLEIGKDYKNLMPLLDQIPKYYNYILEYQAGKFEELEGTWIPTHDPHPSPKCVYNFVKYYIFDGKDSQKLVDIVTDSHANWSECWQWIYDNNFDYHKTVLPDVNDSFRDESIPAFKDIVWYIDGVHRFQDRNLSDFEIQWSKDRPKEHLDDRQYRPVKWPCHTVFRDIEW